MSLQLSYRPDSFDQIVGNESTVRALTAKLDSDDVPHAFLITGPSGCGKTTLARLIAKHLGVLDDVTATGGWMANYRELDSADFRGIETIREIRKGINRAAIGGGKVRVFLMDECHQLTKDAQEALLKALEDTPAHIYFILATTDPQKLKVTLKRRCAHYEVKAVADNDLIYYLNQIASECEEKPVPEQVIQSIVDESMGSMGIAMSLLDKVIDLDPADMEEQVQMEAMKLSDAIELCRLLMAKSPWKKVAEKLKELKQQDPEGVRRLMLIYCTNTLLKAKNDKAYLILDCFREPFYTSPFEQLVMACYEVIEG